MIRPTVKNDLYEEPETERTGVAGMGLVVVGWILLRQDPEGCLMLRSCRGRRRIHALTVLCRGTEAGIPVTVRFSACRSFVEISSFP